VIFSAVTNRIRWIGEGRNTHATGTHNDLFFGIGVYLLGNDVGGMNALLKQFRT